MGPESTDPRASRTPGPAAAFLDSGLPRAAHVYQNSRMRRTRPHASRPGERAAPLEQAAVLPAVVLLLLGGAIAFAAQLHYAWPFTADDAFITFRYAANWAAGHGPNFNPDGPRSEGVTSFGFLLIATLAAWLGFDPVPFAKGFGVACALATAGLLALLSLDLDRAVAAGGAEPAEAAATHSARARLAAAFACFLWLGCYATAVHAASGMETLFGCALLTALVRVTLRAQLDRQPPGLAFGLLALALGLVRPEQNAVAAAALLAALAGAPPGTRRAWLRSAALGWWLPGALYFAARASYYGHLFPIPFYAKIARSAALPGAANALALAKLLLGGIGFAAALPLLSAPRAACPLAGVALVAVLVAVLPDPVMDFDYRYALPALPIVFALAGVGGAQLVEWIAGEGSRRAGRRSPRHGARRDRGLRGCRTRLGPRGGLAARAARLRPRAPPDECQARARARGVSRAGAARAAARARRRGRDPLLLGMARHRHVQPERSGDRDRWPRRSRLRARSGSGSRDRRLGDRARVSRPLGKPPRPAAVPGLSRARHAARGDPVVFRGELPVRDGAPDSEIERQLRRTYLAPSPGARGHVGSLDPDA